MEHLIDLDELQFINSRRQREWDPSSDITIEYRGCELAGEVGELCNQLKKVARVQLGLRGSEPDYDNIKKELGDVIICATLIANHLELRLQDCVKKAFNETSEKYGLETRL